MLRALALSLALHAALVMVVRPAPRGQPVTWVINARILPQPPVTPPRAHVPQPVPAAPQRPVPATAKPPVFAPAAEQEPVEPAAEQPEPRPPVQVAPPPPPLPAATGAAGPPGGSAEAPSAPAVAAGKDTSASGSPNPASSPSLPEVPVMLDTTWYTAREVDLQPKPLQPINPGYPLEARRSGIEGSVVLEIRLDQAGEVQDVKVVEADPPGVFDASALAAFSHARFAPARRNGLPVRVVVRIRVSYQLTD